jgi:RNA polymerase sigma factor (sigma-70 family)
VTPSGDSSQDLFRKFIEEMNKRRDFNLDQDDRTQIELFQSLMKTEKEFRDMLLSTPEGLKTYDDFVSYIVDDVGNILHAQIFFRERQHIFYRKTSKAFKDRKSRHLHNFRINYRFAKWTIESYRGPNKRKLGFLLKKIIKARRQLCENNLPLPINRAKKFWFKVPELHLQYMDHIQNANEGLLEAIDKFVPSEGAFGHLTVGRVTLNLMTDQNSTLIKFSPKERRILYRANNAKNKENMTEDEEVTDYVNQKFKGVSKEEIERIANAAQTPTSLDAPDQFGNPGWDSFASPVQPSEVVEASDTMAKLRLALSKLSIADRKIIRLKHGYQ